MSVRPLRLIDINILRVDDIFGLFLLLRTAACAALAIFFSPSRSDEVGLLADSSPRVEEVDFGTRSGAVLQLPRQTTVIWMSDDRAVQQ